MDTSQQATVTAKDRESSAAEPRRRRSIAEKRGIVEETLTPGGSVARVARVHGVNANQVFGWRRLYLAGRLAEQKAGIQLLRKRLVCTVAKCPLRVRWTLRHGTHQTLTIFVGTQQFSFWESRSSWLEPALRFP